MALSPIDESNESPRHPTYSELMKERDELKRYLELRERESEPKDMDNLERLVGKEIDFIRQDKKRRECVLEFFLRKELVLSSDLERSQQELLQSKLMLGVFEQRDEENVARHGQFIDEIAHSRIKVSVQQYSNKMHLKLRLICNFRLFSHSPILKHPSPGHRA